MAEGTTSSYIAARKGELIDALAAHLPPEEAQDFKQIARLLIALLHHEAGEKLEALKAAYDPLDPDALESRRDQTPAAFETFSQALADALQRANFTEIEAESIRTRAATKLLTDLSIKPSSAGIRRVRYFARGARPETIVVKRWFGLMNKRIEADVMSDVVVVVGFKSEAEISREDRPAFARMRRGVRPGATLVKHFHNIAAPELVTLHPNAQPSMRPRDQVFLAAPAVAGGVPLLLNLWPALTVLAALATATFTAGVVLDNDRLAHAVGALGGLVALGAFIMRQRLKFEATTLRYHKRLADTVYFRNLANNAGVLDLLIGAGEEQDAKEAVLAYWALRRAARPLTRDDIDHAAEAFLRDQFGLTIDFEIGDALAKLERLQLVSVANGVYTATDPADALARLDLAWDSLFNFSTRRTA